MPVELRKRKAPAPAPEPPARKRSAAKPAAKASAATKNGHPAANGPAPAAATSVPLVGDVLDLAGFGGTISTHDGRAVTLQSLVAESDSGVVLFTYPRASTPGCTTQVCLFRDAYAPLTATGLAIYGLSSDSPKANTTFATKQKLPYPLLCDPEATLIKALGLVKAPKGTKRGVFVVDKAGKVLVLEEGGPAKTVEVVRALVEAAGGEAEAVPDAEEVEEKAEEVEVEKKAEEVETKAGEAEEKTEEKPEEKPVEEKPEEKPVEEKPEEKPEEKESTVEEKPTEGAKTDE